MVRVLFVDDDTPVLDALRRQLHAQRGAWEMHFVSTPTAALKVVDEHAPDVVVTDLRLPEMDGAKLLSEVGKRSPNAVRIVLSGMVNQRSFVESVGVAHQFLPKPFDAAALRNAIGRACDLRRWVARPEIMRAVQGLGDLPPLPQTYRQLTEAIRRDASLSEMGKIISADPSLTARLLQVANSAFFSPRRPITSAELAASFLGLEMLRPIVLVDGIGGGGALPEIVKPRLECVFRHSLEVAARARALAQHEKLSREDIASAFSLGVMHDIGAILLAKDHDPIDSGTGSQSADEVESEKFGLTHTEAGAFLALSWGLPDDIVEVIASHHDPIRFGTTGPIGPGLLVAAAGALLEDLHSGGMPIATEGLRAALNARGLSDRVDTWKGVIEAADGSTNR